jgi:RHS repeat-associated protein
MNKISFIAIILLLSIHTVSNGQASVVQPTGTGYLPACVVNQNHIVVSGKTLTTVGQTHTYTANFFYPAEVGRPIQWLVLGGIITAQNNDPSAGPLYVTVLWNGSQIDFSNFPSCINNIPHPSSLFQVPYPLIGVVAITQGTVFNDKIYQAAGLPVMQMNRGCGMYPTTQNLNYQETPCLISGRRNCIDPASTGTHTYQWKQNIANAGWTNIAGATQVDYQPPAVTQAICYSRETNLFDPTNGALTNFDNTGSCITINNFNAGQLYTDNFSVALGSQPTIVDEMPYGGMCTSSGYQFNWWVSYNDKPWELIGNTLHFPGLTKGITSESVRIKRSTICNGVELSTNILEFGYTSNSAFTKENQNYIKENTILVKGVESFEQSELLPVGQKIQTTTYYDGLARPMQKLTKEVGTPDADGIWKDVVTPIEYNALGQQVKSYLPYTTTTNIGLFKTDAFTAQASYYTTNYNEAPAYAETTYELNPLNRVKQAKSAGSAWAATTGNQFEFDLNDVAEQVKIWTINYTPGAIPSIVGNYPTNELMKQEHKDEKLNRVIEYTDKNGNVILKKVQIAATPSTTHAGWLCTYNVYDNLGQLRYTITPKAVEYLENNLWPTTIPATTLKELCFSYEYDAKGRVIVKGTPQAGYIRYVYDKRDRLVCSQDENQFAATTKKWFFILYDDLDRRVVTGLMNSTLTRDALQTQVNNLPLTNTSVTISLATGHTETALIFNSVHSLGTGIQYNSINYYDNYTYLGAKSFSTLHKIPASTDPNVDAITKSNRTMGMSTGSKSRVLDNTNKYLITTNYYDDNGRVLQSLSENIKAGTDVLTNQYDFADKVLHSSSIHTAAGTGYTNFEIITENEFDALGRIRFLRKNYEQTVFKPQDLAEYSYDDLGRMKVKKLGLYGGSQIESLEYSYNINGQLTGINKFYATKDPARYNKWGNYFGLYLGYDNKDNAFAKAELNGNITGAIWCTQGDDNQRKYDYYYDAANQFVKASFTQKDKTTNLWTNTKFNFSVGSAHTSGNIQYDANGNILQMTQMGVLPNKTPFVMDDLRYTYANNGYSNKLTTVADVSTNANNGALKDFKDGTNGTAIDYDYDSNGNLVLDKNKGLQTTAGASGIKYNFLDKVEEIVIANMGTIKYVYDASGEKLQKIFTPLTGAVKTTTYINEYVYSDNALQYIHFEEGRVRVIDEVNFLPSKFLAASILLPGLFSTPKGGVFDYFITDHLGNTRMILTDEVEVAEGLCTAELANQFSEEPQFGAITLSNNVSPNNELKVTRVSKPPLWTSNPSQQCVGLRNINLNSDNYAMGPNVILKVMAGDVIYSYADYYYAGTPATPTNNIISPLSASLVNAINAGGVNTTIKGAGFTSANFTAGGLSSFVTTQPSYGVSTAPRAYLNIIYLDEQFNYVGAADPIRVGTNNMDYIETPANLKCPQNGYAYVFLSNATENMFVYFDNFKVNHTRGRIVEENHYYPFGLKIAAISSSKLGTVENGHLQNRFGYQGAFAEEDEYTGWNEFELRNYDPQRGRWTGVDPYDQFNSGYLGMGNNPVNYTDPTGGLIDLSKMKAVTSFLDIAFTAGNLLQDFAYLNIVRNNIHSDPNPHGPGLWYKTEDAAASGWARRYGKEAIESSVEMGSSIFHFKHEGVTYYSFTEPNYGDGSALKDYPGLPFWAPEGSKIQSFIHSHTYNKVDYIANDFSTNDNFHTENKGPKDMEIYQNYNEMGYNYSFYLFNNAGEVKVLRRFEPGESSGIPQVISGGFAENPIWRTLKPQKYYGPDQPMPTLNGDYIFGGENIFHDKGMGPPKGSSQYKMVDKALKSIGNFLMRLINLMNY